MGLVREAFSSVSTTLAEEDGNGKGGGSGADMDGCSSSEIETAEDE